MLAGILAASTVEPADASVPCTKIWTGEDDDQYTNPLNWLPTVVPGPNDYACADDDVVFDAGIKVVRGINFTAGLSIEGGELRVGAGSTADGSFVEDLYLGSRLGGRSPLTITGSVTLFDGAVIGSPKAATGALGGTVTLAPGARFDVDERLSIEGERTLRNEGAIHWLFDDIVLCDDARIDNTASFFASSNNGTIVPCEGGNGSLTNRTGAMFVKQALGTASTISVPFENDGSIVVEDDVLAVGPAPAGAVDQGSVNLMGSASLELVGDRQFAPEAAFTGAGWVRLSAGSTTLSGGESLRNLAMTGGSLRGGPTITNSFEWYGGSLAGAATTTIARGAYLRVESDAVHELTGGHTLRNDGDLGWFSGDIGVCDGSVLDNAGTLRIQSLTTRRIYPCGVAGSLRNRDAGSIAKQAGPEAVVDVPVVNEGLLDVQDGEVLRLRAVVNQGSVVVGDESRLSVGEPGVAYRQLAGTTELAGPGAALRATGTGAVIELDGGELVGSGSVVAPVVVNAGATVEPGLGIGVLSVVGDYVQAPQGRLSVEIDGANTASPADRLTVTGTADLQGTLDLITRSPAESFTLLTASSRTGTFGSLVGAQLPDATYRLAYGPTDVTVSASVLPRVGLGDASVGEGDSGTRTMLVPVTLDRPATGTVVVRYRIVAGSAQGGRVDIEDFGGVERTLTFKPAASSGLTAVSKTIPVKVYGDSAVEGDEPFTVEVVGVSGAVVGRAVGAAKVIDDETDEETGHVVMGSVAAVEGDSGLVKLTARVTLSRPASTITSVVVTAVDLTAGAGVDYKALKPKTITFQPGATQLSVTLVVLPDAEAEVDRQLQLCLGSPVNLAIQGSGCGLVTILDDD